MKLKAPFVGLTEALDASETAAHLWVGRVSRERLPQWIDDAALLDSHERDVARRLTPVDNRAMFLASHTALRLVLSLYTGQAPHELAFETRPGQRPELLGSAESPPVRFSLTHTSGLFAVAVTRRAACGVDAEHLSAGVLDDATLCITLSASELAQVRPLEKSEAAMAFHRLWTCKEAVLKAIGTGLRLDPRRVSVDTEDEATVNDPSVELHLRTGWRVRTLLPTSDHVVSVAIRSMKEKPHLTLIELEPSLDVARIRELNRTNVYGASPDEIFPKASGKAWTPAQSAG